MRIGIISDIHGNFLALKEVLREARSLGTTELLILGDFVGYYYEADKVLEALSGWRVYAIAGNHETMMTELLGKPDSFTDYEREFGSGLTYSLSNFSKIHIDYLMHLPQSLEFNIEAHRFYLCHGAPWSSDFYIYPDSPIEILSRCEVPDVDYVLMGHTHYPMVARLGHSLLLNPGSVGQSRDLGGLASWLLLDTANGVFSHRRTAYPVDELIAEVKKRDPNIPKLWQVLLRGRLEGERKI